MDNDRLAYLKEAKETTEEAWRVWRMEAEEDFKFRLGEQWSQDDLAEKPDDYPDITLNIIHKPFQTHSGYMRQNHPDLKVFPMENGDRVVADVHTQLIKHTMNRRGCKQDWFQACDDSMTTGIGCAHLYLDYTRDRENGDITLCREDPFKMWIDPYFSRLDLSDAGHVNRSAYLSKQRIVELWGKDNPDLEEAINAMPGEQEENKTILPKRDFRRYENMMNVTEHWYREHVSERILIDLSDGTTEKMTEGAQEVKTILADLNASEPGRYTVFFNNYDRIKLLVGAGNTLLYDDENPYGIHTMYPFIFIFAHYAASYPEIKLRFQGIVRKYKGIQREKNKRRAAAIYTILNKKMDGYFVQDNVTIKPEAFDGDLTIVRASDISEAAIRQIPQPQFPDSQVALEQLFDNDATRIGDNADLLGMIGEGSGSSAPGVTLQLRQRQALTSMQEIYDNRSAAWKMVGDYHIALVNKYYQRPKIEKICGENLVFLRQKREIEDQIRGAL